MDMWGMGMGTGEGNGVSPQDMARVLKAFAILQGVDLAEMVVNCARTLGVSWDDLERVIRAKKEAMTEREEVE